MILYLKLIAIFLISYFISRIACQIIINYQERKNENFGGDGSLRCPFCKTQLSLWQTMNLERCPHCRKWW